eukprot:SAG31_NODE_6851_length_1870_cov_1.604178_2_plen_134_part_00
MGVALWSQVLEKLLRRSANPNSRDRRGWTPLHRAASANRLECLGPLLKAKADPNLQDDAGWTALHWAQTAACAEVLFGAGAREDVQTKQGETPEVRACKNGSAVGASVAESDLATFFIARREERNKNKKIWED